MSSGQPEPAPAPEMASAESASLEASPDAETTAEAAVAAIGAKVAAEMETSPASPPVTPVEISTETLTDAPSDSQIDPAAASGDREDQMAAIRQMLSDLKEGAEEVPESETEEDPVPEVEPAPPPTEEDLEYERDSLKSRIDGANKRGKKIKGEAQDSGYDSAKLRRLHEKRAKKLQRARARRNKSGAFVTGFTLVTMVAATMVGLYVLQPQIVDVSPKMGPALNEYVVTVDRYRIQLDEVTGEWRNWLTERITRLSSEG